MSLTGDLFPKLNTEKYVVIKCLKSPVSGHLWTVNMLKRVKHCPNLQCSSFVKFSYDLKITSFRKILS